MRQNIMSILERLKTRLGNLGKKRAWRSGTGLIVISAFVLSALLINSSVQALNLSATNYGYYGGSYGYNASNTSSDYEPATPGSQTATAGNAKVSLAWTAVTLTRGSTSLDNFSAYKVYYSTTSANVLDTSNAGTNSLSASVWTSTNDSDLAVQGAASSTRGTVVTGLTNGTTYYFAVYAIDANGNYSSAPTAVSAAPSASSSSTAGGGGSGGVSSGSITTTTQTQTTNNTTTTTPATPSTAPSVADISQITSEAQIVGNIDGLLHSLGVTARNNASERSFAARIKTVLGKVGDTATLQMLINFVTYGTASTQTLGAGERLGVLSSYRAAYGRVPATGAQWLDVLKIANGRWPTERSAKAETKAQSVFKLIYKHTANMSNANENAAVTVMAYGLRPANRNLASERTAVKNFRGTFRRAPTTANDWDAVRAIAYSGAKR